MAPTSVISYALMVLQGVTNDAFEWISDSEEAAGNQLAFYFSSYSLVPTVQLKFPVGDTYIFDIERYESYYGQPTTTVQVRIHFVWMVQSKHRPR